MRILYIISVSGFLAMLLLWLGALKILQRRLVAIFAFCCLALGGGLLALAVFPGNNFYGPVFYKADTKVKVIALTFDDGPYPPYTEQLLKVLEEEKVPATFFLVGENALKHTTLVKQVQSAGHEIALHSYVHRDQLKLSAEEVAANLTEGKAALAKITGASVKLFRPPHGFKDWTVMAEIEKAGLKAVNWSVIPRDWTNPGADVIAQRVIEKAEPGAIVLLHDGDSPSCKASREQTVQATGKIIRELRKQGYRFVTISELMEINK